MKKFFAFLLFWIVAISNARGQDPNFAQFFSSPLNINPALTGNINGDWRVISNFRDQWIGPASPYMTGSISYDRKVMQDKMAGVEEGNVLGIMPHPERASETILVPDRSSNEAVTIFHSLLAYLSKKFEYY